MLPRRVLRRALDGGKNRVRFVARFDEQALGEIFFGMIEGVENHALDLLVGQSIGRLHFDLRRFTAALLTCGDLQNAVGIDQELHFDARQAGAHRRNAFQIEACQRTAVGSQFALALHHVNRDVGLAVDAGGEVFGRRCGDR